MNPLDRQELQPFLRNLKEEMPIHTHNTAKIKRSYSQGMPKNLMDYSAFVNNHFLNDNLAIIEEMQHRNKQHPIPKWFRQYQLRHYAKYGILKGDHFFGPFAKIFPDLGEHRGIGFLPYAGMTLGFGTIGDTKVFGSTLEVGGTGGGSTEIPASYIWAHKTTGGVINTYYDTIGFNVISGTGDNMRAACYDDNVSMTLYAETANSAPGATGWFDRTVTEFLMTQSNMWIAGQQSGSTVKVAYQAASLTTRYKTPITYGAFPNPYSGYTEAASTGMNFRAKHS